MHFASNMACRSRTDSHEDCTSGRESGSIDVVLVAEHVELGAEILVALPMMQLAASCAAARPVQPARE